MTIKTVVTKEWFFYTASFLLFSFVLFFMNKSYIYTAKAPASIAISAADSPSYRVKNLQQNISGLAIKITAAKDANERAQFAEHLASAYYDVFSITHQKSQIDSASFFAAIALKQLPASLSVLTLNATLAQTKGDLSTAQTLYEKAISLAPKSANLYQSLGVLLMYSAKQPEKAKQYFEKALQFDTSLPGLYYSLAQIAMSEKNATLALDYFEKELSLFTKATDEQKKKQPDLTTAALYSSMQLCYLYSTVAKNAQKAQDRYNLYMSLENDPDRKQQTARQIQSYWSKPQDANSR